MPAGLCDFYQLGAKIYVKTTDSRRICKRVQIDLIQLIYSRSRLCLRFFVRCADITQDGGVDTAIETSNLALIRVGRRSDPVVPHRLIGVKLEVMDGSG